MQTVEIPNHTLSEFGYSGVGCIAVAPEDQIPVRQPHTDAFLQVMVCDGGTLDLQIEFDRFQLTQGKLAFILPGQVHSYAARGCSCKILFIDDSLVPNTLLRSFRSLSHMAQRQVVQLPDGYRRDIDAALSGLLHTQGEATLPREVPIGFARLAVSLSCMSLLQDRGMAREGPTGRKAVLFEDFCRLVEQNFRQSRQPSSYAKILGIAPAYLAEIVREMAGCSTTDYITSTVMRQARRLLTFTRIPAAEIAEDLGFEDPAYFSRRFSQHEGCSPAQFRRRNRG